MFQELKNINTRPEPFEFYTAGDLWTDEYTSKQMLAFHLDEKSDLSSRNGDFINRSVEWISQHFNIGMATSIADFGCGPGLYTSRLAKRNAEVTGIDFSLRSIQYAQDIALKERLNITYVNQDYLTFETSKRFDLILLIMCDFCSLGPVQRKLLLRKIHSFLLPGGHIIFDVYSLKAFDYWEEKAVYAANLLQGFWSPNKYYGFLNTFKYPNELLVLDKYTIVEQACIRTVYNWFQCFSLESLQRELTECGFSLEEKYSDVAGTPFNPESSEFAVVAKPFH